MTAAAPTDAKPAPEKKGAGCMGQLVGFGLIIALASLNSIFHFAYNVSYDLWSRVYFAGRLSSASTAIQSGRTDDAIASILPLLREHPDNPRLLYFIAGAYWDRENFLLANFYTVAYFKSARHRDSDQALALARLLAADRRVWPYWVDADPEFNIFKGLPLPLASRDSLWSHLSAFRDPGRDVEYIAASGEPWLTLQETSNYNWWLYETMSDQRRRKTIVPAKTLLATPADQEGNRPGLVFIAVPDKPSSYWTRDWGGGRAFQRASLWDAIRTGTISVSDSTLGGSDCCSLSLDDPDLRPMDTLMAEFLARERAARRPPLEETADGMNRLLDFRQRVMLKRAFVTNYLVWAKT